MFANRQTPAANLGTLGRRYTGEAARERNTDLRKTMRGMLRRIDASRLRVERSDAALVASVACLGQAESRLLMRGAVVAAGRFATSECAVGTLKPFV